jgi:hypothetical protein
LPYAAFKRGDQYCVHKLDMNDQMMGDSLGCHDSEEEANRQVRALYANERKEVSPLVESHPESGNLLIYKGDDGRYRWIASFSNNVRDDDNPAEILTSLAQERFVYVVDKGLVPMPELWLYHLKDWLVGEADWVAIDKQGQFTFNVASGTIYDYAVPFVKSLAGYDVALSHGMYSDSIERDSSDPTLITGFISREISILPRDKAANKLTSFSSTTESKDKEMIASKKRQALEEAWPGASRLIDAIEEANSAAAEKALELQLEFKEAEPVAETQGNTEDTMAEDTTKQEEPEVTEVEVETEAKAETEAPAVEEDTAETADEALTKDAFVPRNEVVEAFTALAARLTGIEAMQQELKEQLGAIETKQKEAAQQEQLRKEQPIASALVDLITNKSAVGNSRTETTEADNLKAPEETKDTGQVGLFFEEFLTR